MFSGSPRYERHLAWTISEVTRLGKQEAQWTAIRLFLFGFFFILVAILAVQHSPLANFTAFAGILLFAGSVYRHGRIARRWRRNQIRLRLLEQEKARGELNWNQLPPLPSAKLNPAPLPHYFSDLDILGEHSLSRLLNATISSLGWQTLLSLLHSNGISQSEVEERRQIVEELVRLRVLRRKFQLTAQLHSEEVIDSYALEQVVKHPIHDNWAPYGVALVFLLQCLGFGLMAGTVCYHWKAYFVLVWVMIAIAYNIVGKHIRDVFKEAVGLESSLGKFVKVAGILEKYRTRTDSALGRLLSPYQNQASPSIFLSRVEFCMSMLSIRANWLLHLLLNFAVPWDHFFTLRLEKVRRDLAGPLSTWLLHLARFEAFISLAEFSVSMAGGTFPELEKNTDGVAVGAIELSHPLIPKNERVSNTLNLSTQDACYLITGSNMSGKSTFLRTIGINLCLAKAGSKVSAKRFIFQNRDLFTSLRIADSLEDHTSSFYAEVKELKKILEAARNPQGPKLLYLIDEIFRGTNNRERLAGSRAYIHALMQTSAVGCVATHDLELVQLETLHPALKNFHFKETIEGDRMHFTYRMESGPCPSTNALRIMEIAGLPTH